MQRTSPVFSRFTAMSTRLHAALLACLLAPSSLWSGQLQRAQALRALPLAVLPSAELSPALQRLREINERVSAYIAKQVQPVEHAYERLIKSRIALESTFENPTIHNVPLRAHVHVNDYIHLKKVIRQYMNTVKNHFSHAPPEEKPAIISFWHTRNARLAQTLQGNLGASARVLQKAGAVATDLLSPRNEQTFHLSQCPSPEDSKDLEALRHGNFEHLTVWHAKEAYNLLMRKKAAPQRGEAASLE